MLFQKNIVKKYLATLPLEVTSPAWSQYKSYFLNPDIQSNIQQSKEEQFQEGFLRELFVKVLGYTLNPSPDYNLITEQKNETNSKKADGAILLDDKVIGVIELKDHKTTDLGKIEQQAFGYKSQHRDARYVIISNFEKLRLYIDNAVDFREWNLFAMTEEEFNELYLCIAWTQVKKGVALKVKSESVSSEDKVTQQLYKDYSAFKREIFADIVANNTDENTPKEHILLLFKKTQKLLDRLLFIFFAEDCGLLPPNSIVLILDQWEQLKEMDEYVPLYARIKKYFGYLDTGFQGKKYEIFAYNGGLFKPDEILDGLKISDELLARFTRRMSEYDYASEVDVNILGHIFENSLNEIEEVTAQINSGEKAPAVSKRKRDGVFYTPQYITKYIVENTVGKLCSEKKTELGIVEEDYFSDQKRQKQTKIKLVNQLNQYREWLLQITICDPACGSGAFLNAALAFLINEHKLIDEMETKVTGGSIVFQNVENSILENNLYGVDINEESVEIAKLALWLRTAKPHRKLNSLNNNIKCGNSLLSTRGLAPLSESPHAPLADKAFDWYREFPQVFREKKNRIWHITTATHDSRTSKRMIDYKVRLLRFHGSKPYADPKWIDEIEEQIITETFAKIVKDDNLKIPAYNICGDHMHFLLVCEEEEIPKIVGKIKSMTSRAVNIAMGRTAPTVPDDIAPNDAPEHTARGHAPLSDSSCEDILPTRGETQCPLWAQKYGCVEIDTEEYLHNAIEYIKNNRLKHELPPLKNIDIVPICTYDEIFAPEYTGGFDVVIGNPPYVQLQSMGTMSDVYAQCSFESYNKSADLYCLFTERGYNLLKPNGLQSFIMPNKWMLVDYGKELRRFLNKTDLQQILNFGDIQFFQDATTYVCIFVTRKSNVRNTVLALSLNKKTYYGNFMTEIPAALQEFDNETFGEEPWIIRPAVHTAILRKMAEGTPLKNLPIEINYGIKTGFNDAFFIDGETRSRLIAEDPKSEEIIKPLLRGRDIKAWVPDLVDLYLINPHNGVKSVGIDPINIDDFPAIKKYLDQFYDKLEKRIDKGVTPYNLRNCDYIDAFSQPKIMYPNMTSAFPFIFDDKGFFGNDKTFMITTTNDSVDLKYLTAIFNSKLCKLWIWYNCPELQGGTREIRKVYFENFPIPNSMLSATAFNNGACPIVTDAEPGADPGADPEADMDASLGVEIVALADKMPTLNADLQQKRSLFLRRLQDNLPGIKINGALETFDNLDFAGFVAELKKQKIKLTLAQQDEWEEYFNQYKTECQSLKTQIVATDKEIDKKVYELYGLTEEEIEVVERK